MTLDGEGYLPRSAVARNGHAEDVGWEGDSQRVIFTDEGVSAAKKVMPTGPQSACNLALK